jgi:hypothetical protein
MRLLILGALLILGNCSPSAEPVEITPPRNPTVWLYDLKAVRASIDGTEFPISSQRSDEDCIAADRINVCVRPDAFHILVAIRNLTTSNLRLDWRKARWVDETGVPRELATAPDGRMPVETIPPNETLRQVATPKDKVYVAGKGSSGYFHTEALVPWDLRAGDPDEVKEGLASHAVPFHVLVTLDDGDAEILIDYEYVLVPKRGGNS